MIRWRNPHTNLRRLLIAGPLSLAVALFASLTLPAVLPLPTEVGFALGYLSFFLGWPAIALIALHTSSSRHALVLWSLAAAALSLPLLL